MIVNIKIKCEVPAVPKFLVTENGQVPIHAVTEEALRELGAAWTEMLLMKARQGREAERCGDVVE
jgi:hypothetical protein